MAGCAVTNSDAFRDRLRRDPFDQGALAGLGVALLAEGRPAQAAAILSTVDGQDVLTDLGEALLQAGLRTDAEARLREALAINPGQVRAAVALVSLLRGDDRFGEAQPLARHAYSLDPAKAAEALGGVLIDRGNLAYRANDPETAEALYRDAVAVLPNYAGAQTNLGNALVQHLRFPEAEAAYRSALAADPGHDGTWFALSLARLLQGDAQEGFRLYEHRRGMAEMASNYNRRPDLPTWRFGEDLAGQRVLIAAEQGAGDVIQFARYVPALARIAATVTLEAPWPMTGLFGALGIPVIPLESEADCDIQIPLMSLPLLLGPDAGATLPYLHPIEERVWRWQGWLDRSPQGRRIGLVCSGDPRHPRDVERSFPLAAYAPLFDLPNVTFVLVQTELREADWDTLDDADNLRFPGAALTDWADTAALLSQLDLLITIDTATAHLAGALGLPVWTLLPFCPDWRWGLGRDDCSWYPSMRLYRQTERGAWDEVIERVRSDLRTP